MREAKFLIQHLEILSKPLFKIFDENNEENDATLKFWASHDAYEKKFGCYHKRVIGIDKISSDVIGFDELKIKKIMVALGTR